MRLVPIQREGVVADDIGAIPLVAVGVLTATAQLYISAGYTPPWICYMAVANGTVVGTCGFKAAPGNGRVEIAYFTFPGYEGKGVATQMARLLMKIARHADSNVVVTAQTLPARNASHRVLEKAGLSCTETLVHPEDGLVLQWQARAS